MSNNISKLHYEILDNAREQCLHNLIPFCGKFTLSGGTALALQIAHRQSFDFDFFCEDPLQKNLLEIISQQVIISSISIDSADELTFFTNENIKVTFLHYPFPHSLPPILGNDNLHLFACNDIAYQKAYTIGRRGEYRDYFDLFTLLSRHILELPKIITITKQLYETVFDEKIFLEQLTYFKDLQNFNITSLNNELIPTPKEVQEFFSQLVNTYIS